MFLKVTEHVINYSLLLEFFKKINEINNYLIMVNTTFLYCTKKKKILSKTKLSGKNSGVRF